MIERPNVSYGDGEIAYKNEILRSLVGSGVHGIGIEGTDDRDEMGIFIEPPAHVIGLSGALDQYVSRTQPEGVRSGPGDVDLTIYSLRKYLRLAIAGNPTILLPLYAPDTDLVIATAEGLGLRGLTPWIVSRQAGQRFLGYLDAQYERMLGGGRQSRVPKRPELVRQHGFDTKYASHALRLSLQGVELMETGRLSLPIREEDRDICLRVKKGMVGLGRVIELIKENRERLVTLLDNDSSPLRAEPDLRKINDWSIGTHQYHWETKESEKA